jgi:hypothetical protein
VIRALLTIAIACSAARAAEPAREQLARLAQYAAAFARNLPRAIAEETLRQRSYTYPPHAHLAIGAAAGPVRASYRYHEIASEYSAAVVKGDASGALLEMRELVSMDDTPVQTPAMARKALAAGMAVDPDRTRKKLLAVFTKLGLVDVASDYGLILLAFTNAGLASMTVEEAGAEWVGTDEALVWNWRQKSGGALEFRGRKTARRPMQGRIWVRKSDGAPLRIQAMFEHSEPKHSLRDEASVEYTWVKAGWWAPATVVHRHSVDGVILTENLYSYEPFHLFTTDTSIQYTGETPKN